jgi:hypothetical protein
MPLRYLIPTINIDGITQTLKGKKRKAYRQKKRERRKTVEEVEMFEKSPRGGVKEIVILEDKQNAKMEG